MAEFTQWHIEEMQLDLDSNTQGAIPIVYGRQGDKDGVLCNIELTQQGVAVQQSWFTGKRVYFESRGNGVSVRKQADSIIDGVVKVVLPEAVFSNIGLVKDNFLRIEDASTGNTIISGTSSFQVYVRRGDLDPNASDYYLEEIENIVSDIDEWVIVLKRLLEQYANEGQAQFDIWFKSVKEVLYGIDPGGSILRELVEARTDDSGFNFPNLKTRLGNFERNTNRQLEQKVNYDYLEATLSLYSGGGVKDVFYSLASLNSMHPNGAMGPMLVYDTIHTDGAHQYTWVVDRWKDIGLFNPEGIAKASVTFDKLSTSPEDVLTRSEKLDNILIAGNDLDNNTIILAANPDSTVFKVPVTKGGVIRFPKIQPITGQVMFGVDENEKMTFRVDWNGLPLFSRYGYTISNDFIEIDLAKVNEVFNEVSLYISIPTASLGTFNIEGRGTIDLDTFEYLNTEPYKNKPEKNLQQLSDSFTYTISVEKLLSTRLEGYDLNKGTLAIPKVVTHMTVKLERLPKQGVLKLPQSNTERGQLFVLVDNEGGFINNKPWNIYSDTWYENRNGVLRIDLAELYKSKPKTHAVYIGYLMTDNDNWYQIAENVVSFEEVFKWGYPETDDVLTDDNFNLPNYVPLVSGKESYIYFDNLLIGKNLYAEPIPVIARNQRDDKVVLTNTSDAVQEISYDGKKINVPIKSVPKNAGSGQSLNVMVIGESTSEASDYMTALAENFTNDVVDINFIGTRSSGGINHEARSGWGSGTLRYVAEANGSTNSFLNPSTGTFDLDYYFENNPDVVVPDMVLLNFGINLPNRYTTNGTTETQMDHYEFFINQFKAKNPNVIFIVGLSFSFNRWSNFWFEPQRDEIMKITKQTNEQFKERENERIFLNPQYVCLDMRLDFPHSEVPSNQFSSVTTKVGTNNVHPATSGYKNVALMTYNAIKYALLKIV